MSLLPYPVHRDCLKAAAASFHLVLRPSVFWQCTGASESWSVRRLHFAEGLTSCSEKSSGNLCGASSHASLLYHSYGSQEIICNNLLQTSWQWKGFFCVLLAELCRGYSRLYKAAQSSWNGPQRSLPHLLSAASAAVVEVSRKAAVGQMGHGPCSAGSASGSVFWLVFQSLLYGGVFGQKAEQQ